MRMFLSTLMLALLAMPAIAEPNPVPEPQSLGLALAGLVAALWVARGTKK